VVTRISAAHTVRAASTVWVDEGEVATAGVSKAVMGLKVAEEDSAVMGLRVAVEGSAVGGSAVEGSEEFMNRPGLAIWRDKAA